MLKQFLQHESSNTMQLKHYPTHIRFTSSSYCVVTVELSTHAGKMRERAPTTQCVELAIAFLFENNYSYKSEVGRAVTPEHEGNNGSDMRVRHLAGDACHAAFINNIYAVKFGA